jgi:hypothetical protein
MKNATWPKAFAYIGLTVMGLTLAFYSTSIATAGVAGLILGNDRSGNMLSAGTAVILIGTAMAAVFAFLTLVQVRLLTRKA